MTRACLIGVLLWAGLAGPVAGQQAPVPVPLSDDGVTALLRLLERALESGDSRQYLRLLSPVANRGDAIAFAEGWFEAGITRAVVRERDRQPLAGTLAGAGYDLNIDIFTEFGSQARLGTWRLGVRHTGSGLNDEPEWQISAQREVNTIDGLHQLQLNAQKQFFARNLVVHGEDFELNVPLATMFVAEVPAGMTGVVVLGRGEMIFSPAQVAEQRQVRIFSGSETLRARVDAAFFRFSPLEADQRITGELEERPIDPRDLRRADALFQAQISKSFALDLRELSSKTWSTVPIPGDFIAELETARYNVLTYARLNSDPEDISLFERRRRRWVALYPSKEKLARRGRFYNEDDLVDYDVLDYDIDASFDPGREWIQGQTRLRIRTKAAILGHFRIRLASELVLQSVVSAELGRLLALRELNQDNIVISLPEALPRGTMLDLVVSYAGRLEPQEQTREAMTVGELQDPAYDVPLIPGEPSWLYSNNSYWYAQSTVTDFATARLQLLVPDGYTSIASGLPSGASQLLPGPESGKSGVAWRQSTFVADRPVRYLGWVISRFAPVDQRIVSRQPDPASETAAAPGTDGHAVDLLEGFERVSVLVQAPARQVNRARRLSSSADRILNFYASLLGEFPYPSLSVAVIERELPGGHSPPYFVQYQEPPPFGRLVWRNDPVYFSRFADFFLAHELAHQWWGQAVGWKNFHEQWLSEGFAQYFAVLYAQQQRPEAFDGVLRQLRRWSLAESDQGPVYLGYRLGHIRGDGRVFRALVYNKGAAVLHMLRRLVGDEAFFRSIRRFYSTWRFQKASTEDLRAAFESETREPLDRFFAGWIYGQDIPQIRFTWRTEGNSAILHFEQLQDEVFVVPVTVSLELADRTSRDQVVIVSDRSVDIRLPLSGTLRGIDINRDAAALAEFLK